MGARAEARLPAFADWYYSLAGENTRLAAAALGNLAGLLAGRLEALAFGPAGTAQALDVLTEQREILRAERPAGYAEGAAAVLAALRSDLEAELSPRPVAPPRDCVPARAGAGD